MSSSIGKKALPNRWSAVPLGNLISLEYGKSFPEKKRRPGPYAVYGSNGIVGRAHMYILEEKTVIVGRKGSAGEVNYAEPKSWPIDTTYYVEVKNPKVSGIDFIYYLLKWLDPRRLIDTTTKPGLNRDRVYEQVVPLPPLPVQERIVQILQKADEIRRKRKEALELVDKILPALFLEMFGDPATNPKGWPIHRLGDVLQSCNSGVWGKQTSDESRGFYVLRSTNMPLDGRIDYSDVALIEIPDKKAQRYALQDGDILLNRSSGSPEHIGKVSLFRQKPEIHKPILFSNFVQRLRVNPEVMTPEYLFFFLRSDFARESLNKLHATSSGLRNIQMKEYLAQEVPVPPLPLQQYFSQVVILYEEIWKRRADTFQTSETLFQTMLVQAFTGELTAEWEAANAEWIAERQAFYERLPRLVILALLAEKAKRAGRAAATVLITALMKYVFLFQMEGNGGRRRLYQFVPYHYGPFSKEVYADLEALEQEGLVRVEKDPEEEKTKITLADAAKIEERLAMLPDDIKQDVAVIIETYGDLDHATLLSTVYEKYPAYARKSQLKRKGRRAQ
jgi:type I restriction enzyme S subunit